jgi:hypothetical protein
MVRNKPQFSTICWLYAGFWAALLYHAFVNFINSGVPASTGWYLHAVVVSEAVLLCGGAQWFGPRKSGHAMAALSGLFLLLEAYATHFVLIPYYVGLTSHRADTTLTSFYVSQATELGWSEILSRLLVHKAPSVSAAVVAALWLAFAFATAYLLALAWRYARRAVSHTL